MTKRITKEESETYAKCAAEYWADLLRTNRAPSLIRDAGDRSEGALFAELFFAPSKKEAPSEEKIRRFESTLRSRIEKALVERGRICLHVDYSPDLWLTEDLETAGLADVDLPYKHTLFADDLGVYVREGYGSPSRYLIETKHGAVRRAVNAKLMATYPSGCGDIKSAEYKAWESKSDKLEEVMGAIPDYIVGRFEDVVDRVWSFVLGETAQDPWLVEGS